MREKLPKSYRGGLQQDLYRSEAFKKRLDLLERRQRETTEKMKREGLNPKRLEKLNEIREKIGSAIARYDIRTHDREALEHLKKEYESLPIVQRLRNEVAHRLRREASIQVKEEELKKSRKLRQFKIAYAHATTEKERNVIQREIDRVEGKLIESRELKHHISLLAASVKLVTGLDDSAAIKRAIEIGKQLPRKDPEFIGDVADDIFLMGEKSIYLKLLNNARYRRSPPNSDGYSVNI